MTTDSILRRGLFAATVIPATLLLAACASGSTSPPPGAMLPQSESAKFLPDSPRPAPCRHNPKKNLYVANAGGNDVLIFCNNDYVQVGEVTKGVSGPSDVSLDQNGNLYIANIGDGSDGSITEYAPGSFSAPSFTYNAGMKGPQTLTVDINGNVFEGDQTNDTVNEYSQGINSVTASCSLGGDVSGVAVNTKGDVFVRYFSSSSDHTFVAEYKGGLSGCNKTVSPLTFSVNGGIALDNKRNLIVCDGNQVDVIDPPYTSISGTIGSGFNFAFGVSLNKPNTLAFVADYIANTVTVVNYPAGTNQTVITSKSGLSEPFGAVDAPNAVF